LAIPAQADNSLDCVNINTAPKEELEKIVHIGESRAEQVINLRTEKLFSSVDDLVRVSGIGPARIADIKGQGLACVGEPQPEPLSPGPEPESEPQPQSQPPPIEPEPQTESLSLEAQPQANQKTEPEIKPIAAETAGPVPEPKPLKVDINAASLKDLQKIVGIGSVIAQRIIDARPFLLLDDLAKIRGIGTATLEEIKKQGLVWVDPKLAPPPKTEETKISQPQIASAALNEQLPEDSIPLWVLLAAITLSVSSGIIIILLSRGLTH